MLFVLLSGLIGGYCIGIYSFDTLSENTLAILREQNVTKEIVAISGMMQYGILFGLFTWQSLGLIYKTGPVGELMVMENTIWLIIMVPVSLL